MEIIARIFCIGLLMFYLLFLIGSLPCSSRENLSPRPELGTGEHGRPHSGRMPDDEDEQPVPLLERGQHKYSSCRRGGRRNLPRPTHSGGSFGWLGVGGIRRYRACRGGTLSGHPASRGSSTAKRGRQLDHLHGLREAEDTDTSAPAELRRVPVSGGPSQLVLTVHPPSLTTGPHQGQIRER